MTRSWAGADRAVTSAVRMGESSPGNSACSFCNAAKNDLNGPPDSGCLAAARSVAVNASSPSALYICSASSENNTASPSKAKRNWPNAGAATSAVAAAASTDDELARARQAMLACRGDPMTKKKKALAVYLQEEAEHYRTLAAELTRWPEFE